MYVSRLTLHVIPGCSNEVEERLGELREMAEEAGGEACRVLVAHYRSEGAPDFVFEQDAEDVAALEEQISEVVSSDRFREWSEAMSTLLTKRPTREVFRVAE